MSYYWTSLLVEAGILAVAAWGLGIAIRAGMLSVGHAALFGVGAYTAGLAAMHGVPLVVAAVAGAAAAGLVGTVLAIVTIRLNHLFLALATLVFGEILRSFANGWSVVGGAYGLVAIPMVDVGVALGLVLIGIVVFELFVFRGSRIELVAELLATSDSLVELGGVSPRVGRICFFAASSAIAGLAGAIAAFHRGLVLPEDLGFDPSMLLLVIVIVGGASSGIGPIVAAFVLALLPERLGIEGHLRDLMFGAILLACLLARPDGLFSRRALPVLARPESALYTAVTRWLPPSVTRGSRTSPFRPDAPETDPGADQSDPITTER